jgi:hypothetical protein
VSRLPRVVGLVGTVALVAAGAACDGEPRAPAEDVACLSTEPPEAASGALMMCIEPPPPLLFTWSVPKAVVVPFGERAEAPVHLGAGETADSLTWTTNVVALRCWDAPGERWVDVPEWEASFGGTDLSCHPGLQLKSPFSAVFTVPGDAPLPPGGGLECVARCEPVGTSWCRHQYVAPPSPEFPVVVAFVSLSGAPGDPAASFALDQTIAYTGAVDGEPSDAAAWQQVRLAARTFTLPDVRDVALAFELAFEPASEGSSMKLDLRFKLDGYVVAEQRLAAGATAFEAVIPGVAAGAHVISVEARGVRVDGEAAPVRITGPGPGPGGEARLEAVFL